MNQLLVVYFLLLPFQWALSPAPGIDLALIRIATGGIFLLWLASGLYQRRLMFTGGPVAFALLSLLFVALGSALWSENEVFTYRKWAFLLSFLPFFFVLSDVIRTHKKQARRLVEALVLGATAMSIVAISIFLAQFVFGVGQMVSYLSNILPWFLGGAFGEAVIAHSSLLVNISGVTVLRASGFLPDPHIFSFFTGMTASLAFGLYWSDEKRSPRFLLAFVILLMADLLTFSRGGYVGLIGGGLWFLLFSGCFGLTTKHLKQLLVVILLIGALLLSPVGARLLSSFSESDGSNQERIRLWRESAVLIAEKPLLGLGLGNYPLRVKPGAEYREPIYAHNQYLDMALELGLIGLGLFLVLLFIPLLRLARMFLTQRDSLALAISTSLVVFLVHALFESPLFSVHILPLLLFLIALGVSYRYDDTSNE